MICELIDGRCLECGWEVPDRLHGRQIFRPCGKREAVQAEPEIVNPKVCSHRGELLRIVECKPCQSGGRVPEVYACQVHGECTLYSIGKRKADGSRWQSCLSCSEQAE